MSCPSNERLNDLVDGLLEPHERHELETHVERCTGCSGVLTDLRSLLARAAELPRELQPGRDLFPGIRNRIAESARRPLPHLPAWTALVAAGLLVVALLPWVTGNGELAQQAAGSSVPAADGVSLAAVEAQFEDAVRQLMASLEQRQARLPPETIEIVRHNLEQIDGAIAEIRLALADDPRNAGHVTLLAALQHQKLELLWNVNRLAS